MPDRPLTILQLTHQGTGSGSTMVIASLSGELVRRGHRVLVGCRAGTTLASLARGAGLPLVPLDFGRLAPLARVDAPPSEDDMAAARAALGELAGRPVVLVLARRKDQHVLLRGLAALERPVVVACVGIEGDPELRGIERTLPARHRVVYVPFTDR